MEEINNQDTDDLDEEASQQISDSQLHVRAHWNSPTRCDGNNKMGPCPYEAIPGSRFCAVHGGGSQRARNQGEAKRAYYGMQYKAQQLGGEGWSKKISVFAEDPNLKNLNQEIGILRLLLDTVLRRCQNENDLTLRSSTITELVDKLGKLVINCTALDIKVGAMLSRDQLAAFGDIVVQLVAEYITNPDQLSEFTRRLIEIITKTGTAQDNGQKLLDTLAS